LSWQKSVHPFRHGLRKLQLNLAPAQKKNEVKQAKKWLNIVGRITHKSQTSPTKSITLRWDVVAKIHYPKFLISCDFLVQGWCRFSLKATES
jgi:hypothetical protein